MSTFMYGIIFAIALLLFCWMLLEYRLRDYRHHPKNGKRLPFGTRTAFVLTHFWKAVDDAKELPHETMIEDLSDIPAGYQKKNEKPTHTTHAVHSKEQSPMQDSKMYRR